MAAKTDCFSYLVRELSDSTSYVTGVAHALRRLCETIHVLYPKAGKLVANGEKTFLKTPARIELSKNKALDAPFTPFQ
jgi:hypothetical protein